MKMPRINTLSLFCVLGWLLNAVAQDTAPTPNTPPAQATNPPTADAQVVPQPPSEAAPQPGGTPAEGQPAVQPEAAPTQAQPDAIPAQVPIANQTTNQSAQTGDLRPQEPAIELGPRPFPRRMDLLALTNAAGLEWTNNVASNETNAPGMIRLNFRNQPLAQVLDYLSDAAGFIIALDPNVGQLRGSISLYSARPVSKDDAYEALQMSLGQSGYSILRKGNILKVVGNGNKSDNDILTKIVKKTNDVNKTEELVTAIIPVNYVSAQELMGNLTALLPQSASISANQSGNALIIVDTEATVSRMVGIVRALDNPVDNGAKIEVIPMKFADAKTLATVLQGLFPDPSQGRGAFNPFGNAGRGGGGGGGGNNPFGGRGRGRGGAGGFGGF